MGGWLRQAGIGRSHLIWRNQHDRIAGVAAIRGGDHTHLAFEYRVCDLVYEEEGAGEVMLNLRWKGSRSDNKRPYATCPNCGREADMMVMRGGAWACTACHNLMNRSAKLRAEIRWSEEIQLLERRLDASLTLETSRRQRDKLEARRQVLAERLGDWRPSANTDYQQVLVPEYVAITGS